MADKIKEEQQKNSHFEDLDLRVAKIEEVKDHPNADKLYIIKLDLGNEEKQIVSGLKLAYKKEDLKNKNIIVINNLESSNIRGVQSNGMLLAVEDDNQKLSLLTSSKSKPGDKVYTDQQNSKPLKEIKFNDFKKIKLITKNNKIYYQDKQLKTNKEDIFLDKEMPDNLIAE